MSKREHDDISEEVCSICYNDLGTENIFTTQRCNHNFHKDCMIGWANAPMSHNIRGMSDAVSCPLCKSPIYLQTEPPGTLIELDPPEPLPLELNPAALMLGRIFRGRDNEPGEFERLQAEGLASNARKAARRTRRCRGDPNVSSDSSESESDDELRCTRGGGRKSRRQKSRRQKSRRHKNRRHKSRRHKSRRKHR